jgi:hypothetical protein
MELLRNLLTISDPRKGDPGFTEAKQGTPKPSMTEMIRN